MLPQSSLIIVGPSKELDPRLQLARLPVKFSPGRLLGHHQVPFSLSLRCTASGFAVGLAPGTLLRHYGLEDRHH
ncbi:hypothetical protein SKAU_G00208850 [Synaphobranchus kaupii]|uniref:Uncharacterized protein n=1 Tax=Synaphobranchus kaupii TaxID=118154 RepID=A0A9Q1F8H9_SYNKA|nr:hypothetical protein SKAU_G00208850 [Synaphobranchus kaupii]